MLKRFFSIVLGLVLSFSVAAQSCETYTGPGSQVFSDVQSDSAGNTFLCASAQIPEGASMFIDNVGGAFETFVAFGANGAFQDFRGAGGALSRSYANLPAGAYSMSWLGVPSTFEAVVGVYPVAAPVPEPSTWALMLAGLAAVALFGAAAKSL